MPLKVTHQAAGLIRPSALHVFAQRWKNLFCIVSHPVAVE